MSLDRGQPGKTITGARCRFSVNGQVIGYARNVSGGETIQYEALDVLDNIETEEHVPVGYSVTLTASMFRIVGSTLKSAGIFPHVGENSEEHLRNVLLLSGIMKATLEDTKTGKILYEYSSVKVSSYNWQVDARGIMGNDIDFVGIRALDESELS
jgi:hypothetical protein